jgi:hypothetical protein
MRIQSYRFGEIVIEGRRYRDDLMVFADRVRAGWWREEGHLLQVVDLKEALAAGPEALIVGTGTQQGMKVATEVVSHTKNAGIELLAFDTRMACQMFNELVEKRRIVAVLHLTC